MSYKQPTITKSHELFSHIHIVGGNEDEFGEIETTGFIKQTLHGYTVTVYAGWGIEPDEFEGQAKAEIQSNKPTKALLDELEKDAIENMLEGARHEAIEEGLNLAHERVPFARLLLWGLQDDEWLDWAKKYPKRVADFDKRKNWYW